MIISYNRPGHLLTDVIPAMGKVTYIVLCYGPFYFDRELRYVLFKFSYSTTPIS